MGKTNHNMNIPRNNHDNPGMSCSKCCSSEATNYKPQNPKSLKLGEEKK